MTLRKMKAVLLSSCAGGMVLFSACAAVDVKGNIVAGVMGFIEDYTADVLVELFPDPADLLNPGDGE